MEVKLETKQQSQFNEILKFIRNARSRVFSSTNKELIELYWKVGRYISERLLSEEWGSKTVDQLSNYIRSQEPSIKGFERRNLYRMRQFYETYPNFEIVSPVVTQLSWTNNLIILSRCKTEEERIFYLGLAVKERYSKRELERQINSGNFERTKLADAKLMTNKQFLVSYYFYCFSFLLFGHLILVHCITIIFKFTKGFVSVSA
ncbi:MAG: hypothetical protein OMM_01298 [Candidatus Magnetoglobus multicellularis str. Araruama]|uniref:YhcG N-terminal domain-containing protein n=1 Tax=Candidatus Magnetoglobus multicellularis str. Araruama TaxID=890399 RepID=A0A1V1PDJ2_9BACT|nr:MAG: hypothetical protein OMM_01298 [Candidatus Magnetoglobus multicellularis str. Araruama]